MILGLVPARGGSKGVPGKNLRLVDGQPLVVRTIGCGLACPSIDRLIVSTDSEEIAEVAKAAGAEVPFMRPFELAGDTTPMMPVMQHALRTSEELYGTTVDAVALLHPTGPLRAVEDVEGAIRMFRESECDAVVSGHEALRSPYFTAVESSGEYVRLCKSAEPPPGRRQDCPEVFDLNAVMWVHSRKTLAEESR